MVRTALNLRVSWWRRLRREVPALDDDAHHAQSTSADKKDHEAHLDLLAAVAGLPERQRHVLALRVYLDLGTRETAEALGIAEGTVTAHLHRATTSLRARLTGPATEPLTDSSRSQP